MKKRAHLSTTVRLLATLLASGAVAAFAGPSGCAADVAVGCATDPEGTGAPCPDASGVASSKLVHELTDADRGAWCAWYVANLSTELTQIAQNPAVTPFPDGHVNEPIEATVVPASADHGDDATRNAAYVCMFRLTVEECQQSLAVQPCTATVQQLDDCYRSALTHGSQTFGEGCDGLRAATSCDGTVLGLGHAADPAPADQDSQAFEASGWCFARVQ